MLTMCSDFRLLVLALLCTPPAVGLTASKALTWRHRAELGNLCIDGHIAPEIILYGPARATTTTFAMNLVQSPAVVFGTCKSSNPDCPEDGNGFKEMHFFEHWNGKDGWKRDYLKHFPKCSTAKRIVAADLTPGAHVPISKSLDKFARFYGMQRARVNFVMLLRKPIQCMYSLYMYEHQDRFTSFGTYVEGILATPLAKRGRYLNNVLYADGLRTFFNNTYFKPSQLMIIPMRYNTGDRNGFKRVTEQIWDDLRLPRPVSKAVVAKANSFKEKEPLSAALSVNIFAAFNNFLEKATGPKVLAEVICRAAVRKGGRQRGPRLYGYAGSPQDEAAVAEWIRQGW